MLLLSLSQ
jgi:hypothetical protein